MRKNRLIVVTSAVFALPAVVCGGRRVKTVPLPPKPEYEANQPIQILSNDFPMPLVGIGVGNLQHELVDSVLTKAIREDGYRMIDTNKVAENERMIADAIEKGMKGSTSPKNVVNVVTKVWYTHLGYERTRLSVQESLENLILPNARADVRVHMLIHWPRCDDGIEWMNCEQEEEDLPQYVKDAGPPPHLHKDTAWKDSWRALEDMYKDPTIPALASIGVSNFNLEECQELMEMATIKPHMHQGHVWSAIHDPHLQRFLFENGVLFQTYGVMHGVVSRGRAAPNAMVRLEHIGKHVMDDAPEYQEFTAAQVILAWFVQNKVSVIPRASSLQHQVDNSPGVIAQVPRFTKQVDDTIHQAVSALLRGEDMGSPHAQIDFVNVHNEPVDLLWHNRRTGEEVYVARGLQPGQRIHQQTWPEHVFVVSASGGTIRKPIRITANFGQTQEIRIDLAKPKARFSSDQPVHLFWSNHEGKEVPVKENLKPGEQFETDTYPGHVFVAYHVDDKKNRKEFLVRANYGDQEHFHIEL